MDLKNDILKIGLTTNKKIGNDDSHDILNTYIKSPVIYDNVSRYGFNFKKRKKSYGSKIIQLAKKNCNELDEELYYEHLFINHINSSDHHIILVGDVGSGKTHKLEYIWHKYINPLPHCNNSLCNKQRLRVFLNIDKESCTTKKDLYSTIFIRVAECIKNNLGDLYLERFNKYREKLSERKLNEKGLSFLPFITNDMLSSFANKEFNRITKLVDNSKELLYFIFDYFAWLRKEYSKDKIYCMYIIIDNIDASSIEIQEGLLSLLHHVSVNVKLICACRPETLRNWTYRTHPIDVIPHIGPSGYEVIIKRLTDWLGLNDNHYSHSKIEDFLQQNDIGPSEFLENLKILLDKVKERHFRLFYEKLFSYQVRDSLIFSQGIIDIAASHTTESLKQYISKYSIYALERFFLLPWGLKIPVIYSPNIFCQTKRYNERLVTFRILFYLQNSSDDQRIRDISEHLSIFGYEQSNIVRILKCLIVHNFIVTKTKDKYDLPSYEECKEEEIKITELGLGLIDICKRLEYVQTHMYFTYIDEGFYQSFIPELDKISEDLDLVRIFEILKAFLKETTCMEIEEIFKVSSSDNFTEYNRIYSNQSITLMMYENIIPALNKIKKSSQSHNALTLVIDSIIDDFKLNTTTLKNRYNLSPYIDTKELALVWNKINDLITSKLTSYILDVEDKEAMKILRNTLKDFFEIDISVLDKLITTSIKNTKPPLLVKKIIDQLKPELDSYNLI